MTNQNTFTQKNYMINMEGYVGSGVRNAHYPSVRHKKVV